MSNKLKVIILGVLCVGAVFSAAFTASAVGHKEADRACFAADGWSYVLRDYEGYVAVFVENEPNRPMTVTDIQVSTLREMDRRLLENGMKVDGQEKLMMTLEDIGS